MEDIDSFEIELIICYFIDSFMGIFVIVLEIDGQELEMFAFHDELMDVIGSEELNGRFKLGKLRYFAILVDDAKAEGYFSGEWCLYFS